MPLRTSTPNNGGHPVDSRTDRHHRRGRSGVHPDGPPQSVPWCVGQRASCCYPNLTDEKYPGNPTRSYRTRHPLGVVGGIVDWMPHDPKVLQGMRDHLEELERLDRAGDSAKTTTSDDTRRT